MRGWAGTHLERPLALLDDAEPDSLLRFNDDAKEVKEGFDCGLMIAGYDDVKEGDVLEFYSIEERQRTL